MDFYSKVVTLCRENGISITALALDLGMSKSTPNNWKSMDGPPRHSTVKKVADYFRVPTEYFEETNTVNAQTVNDNHGIIGSTHAPVTIINGNEHTLTEEESELLRIFSGLSIVERAKLLVFASNLKEGKE